MKVGLVLTLAFAVLGSVRFARFDWSGLPTERVPMTAERQVGDCHEVIRPYVTESGRVVKPVVVDEMQYMALVEYFRGVPRSELQVSCLYDPFTYRAGVPWLAHWLPWDEALSLGLTNSLITISGIWIVLFTLRSQGFSAKAILAAGALYSVSWNPAFFGTGLLVDSGAVAALGLCWYLLVRRRVWLIMPLLAVGYPLRESFGIIVVVLWAWCWNEYRADRRSTLAASVPAVFGSVLFGASVLFWRAVLPDPQASWDVTPGLGTLGSNLGDPIGLITFAIGVLPLALPSYFVYRRAVGEHGRLKPLIQPATTGVVLALGFCVWAAMTAALSPRMFWIGFPFAASLTAEWFSSGRPGEWLDSLDWPFLRGLPSVGTQAAEEPDSA